MNFTELSPFDRGWIIGLLEGEASFCNHKKTCPHIDIEMTDKDTLDKLRSLLIDYNDCEIRTRTRNGNKPTFRYRINGKKAVLLMVDLYPFMSERRKHRIQEIILDYGSKI